MTADEALASIREDIDRLERKDLVKPGHIARRRAEVNAIEHELNAMAAAVDRAEFAQAQAEIERTQAEQRTGMLANLLLIMGFSVTKHMSAPVSEAHHYERAARMVQQQRRNAGRLARSRSTTTMAQLMDLASTALFHARLEHALQPFEHLLAKHQTTHDRKQEEAAA